MVTQFMFKKIRQLAASGLNNSEIARQLKVDRKTVSKYRCSNAPPKYKSRSCSTREDHFALFEEQAKALMTQHKDLTATEIFLILKNDGYKGSERTVQRRVAEEHLNEPKERFFEQEYQPGEQCQFDFKESVKIPFQDGDQISHLHFGTLPFCDLFFIKGFPNKAYESFMDGAHSFFEHIGGMPTNVRIDNLSPCVSKVLKGSRRVYTKAFQRAIDHYGFNVLPCAPAKGNQKGDVERDIRTWSRRLQNQIKLTGRVFKDYNDLNEWLSKFCMDFRKESTSKLLEEEKQKLLPLPERDVGVLCHVDTIRVTAHGTVRIEKCKSTYSVPDHMIGQWCKVILSPFDVSIYRSTHRQELVCKHTRKTDGEHSIALEHTLPSLIRKPGAMIRWAHRNILFPFPSFEKYYKFLKNKNEGNAEKELLKAVNLVQHTTLNEISLAMELVMEGTCEVPFVELKKLLLCDGHHPLDTVHHLNQKPLKPELSEYDFLIPNLQEKNNNEPRRTYFGTKAITSYNNSTRLRRDSTQK